MIDRFDKKYKAIVCEIVELLAKHGLTAEETEFVMEYAKATFNSAALVTQPKLEEIQNLLK